MSEGDSPAPRVGAVVGGPPWRVRRPWRRFRFRVLRHHASAGHATELGLYDAGQVNALPPAAVALSRGCCPGPDYTPAPAQEDLAAAADQVYSLKFTARRSPQSRIAVLDESSPADTNGRADAQPR